jgi:hypothetical protein
MRGDNAMIDYVFLTVSDMDVRTSSTRRLSNRSDCTTPSITTAPMGPKDIRIGPCGSC